MKKSSRPLTYLVTVMKIACIPFLLTLLFSSLSLASNGLAQELLQRNVTLKAERQDLRQVLTSLEKSTGVRFSYVPSLVRDQKVTITAENQRLSAVLDQLLAPLNIRYSVSKDYIILNKKPGKSAGGNDTGMFEISGHEDLIDRVIRGKVTAADTKEPLPGVSVVVKGTQHGTSTEANGTFEIEVPNGDTQLVFSFVGYLAQEVNIGSQSELDVTLLSDTKSLQEVVVIGYGTVKKADLSASVSTVPDMDQIKNRPVLNVGSMIQGKVAGVTAISNGGHPNQTPNITIRGTGSRGGESVLYVVDGVPNAPYNPADIESITVLKDAASAAIYGAFSGSAGVILITTRQASQGKPSIEYSGFMGMKQAWKLPQSLNAADEAKVSNLAYTNAGLAPLDGWDASKNPYAQVTRADWVDEIFRTGLIQRHNLSFNAGTDKFSTLLQGRYERDEGTLINTYAQNLSVRFNAVYKFTDKIKLRQELFYNNNDNRGTETTSGYSGTILSAIYMPRSAVPYYEDGTFGGVGPRDSQYLGIHGDAISPVGTLMRYRPYNKSNDMQSVTELGVSEILPGLSFVSRFSYRQNSSLWKNFEPKRTEPGKPNNQNTLSYATNRGYHWIWENTANFSRVFGRHNVGAMASMTAQENGNRSFSIAARGFENEADWAQFFVNASIFDQNRPGDDEWKDRNASYVGRLSYSWADRYFVTASYRYDIAGRLAEGFRAKGYPGFTGAWKLSSEPFFNVKGIDLFKLRASWGRIGNIGSIGRYYGYPNLTPNNTYQIGNGAPISNGLYVNARFNPELSWETSQQTDFGLDISLLKEKLTITADYFNKLTYDLIKQQDTEWTNTNGYGAPFINQGKIRNTGFEFAASWRDQIGELGYEIGGNFATLKNRVDYIDENPNSVWTHGDAWRSILVPFRSTVGQPYFSYWLIKNAGIFQTDEAAAAYVGPTGDRIQPGAKAGDLKFVDENGDGKIDDSDRVYMGNAFPKITYGITANANWKNFDFSIFFQGVGGVKLFNAFKQSTLNGAEQGYNRWDKILDAWSETNTGSDIPKIRANDPNKNFSTNSDWYLENGNYLRLKNLIIGYTFKSKPGKPNLRVYVSGDNLLTFTKYSGMDPEIGSQYIDGRYTAPGLDGGQYPVARVYSAGVKLKF
jgi:TonB-linked SusC/RagA family outer membrane protein